MPGRMLRWLKVPTSLLLGNTTNPELGCAQEVKVWTTPKGNQETNISRQI